MYGEGPAGQAGSDGKQSLMHRYHTNSSNVPQHHKHRHTASLSLVDCKEILEAGRRNIIGNGPRAHWAAVTAHVQI